MLDSVDCILDKTAAFHRSDFLPLKFIRTLKTTSLLPAQLRLKLGAPVIFLQNLTSPEEICNGTYLQLIHIGQFILEGQILDGDCHGKKRLIPRILMNNTGRELSWIVSRKQFLIILYFTVTVNKSQSQSLYIFGVDLQSPSFTHGQLFIFPSLIIDISKLCVLFL